jgi:D-arabinose 1-dehydrogenase-like Zn-dependent alcohol dehydrogenase
VQAYDSSDELLHKRVFLSPLRKWKDGPAPSTSCVSSSLREAACSAGSHRHGAPEILGSGITVPAGVFAEYVVVDRAECIPTPAHLDDVHAAAWPLGGVTAWRCVQRHMHRIRSLMHGAERAWSTRRSGPGTTS